MSEEEKEAIESVKSMFGNITIEKLIKDKIFNITICSLGILDILRVIAIVDNQQKEIEEKNCLIDVLQHRIEELLDNKKEINYIKPIDIPVHNYISKEKIREKIKALENNYNEKHDIIIEKYSSNQFIVDVVSLLEELLEEK